MNPFDRAIHNALREAQAVMPVRCPTERELRRIITAYEEGLNQPIRLAKKDGHHVLGWRNDIGMWTPVRCVHGSQWPHGFTKFRPMPQPIEGR